MGEILYRVRLAAPGAHLFAVELRVPSPDPHGQRLSLPAWIPGSYMIRDFARNIVTLGASCDGAALAVTKLDKQTWLCAPCAGPLTINYQVYAWDLSVRSAHFDTTHAYFNGTSLFLQVRGQERQACLVELEQPVDASCAGWKVATTLAPRGAPPYGFGRYGAADYAELIDHPVEIGDLAFASFQAGGKPHEVAVYGRQRADLERLCRDLRRICEQHIGLFGELPPQRYLFLVMAVGEGYGGLEHRDSTSLLCSRNDLPAPQEEEVTEEYRGFLGLCSHEYFHLWNVKRIAPAVFQGQGLEREVHTRLLWVFEGITSYYDDLALVRSGCIDAKSYLDLLARTITRVMRGSGRLKQSVAESSFDAWTKFYKQDENAPNAIVSYYAKGALIALALDLTLRLETSGVCSLDQVMHALWQRYGKTGRGVPEDAVESLVQEVSGLELSGFFDQAVRGTVDLPLAQLLVQVGVELRLRPAKDAKDAGAAVDEFSEPKAHRSLGLRLMKGGVDAVIAQVLDGGAAQQAGLAAGDTLVALNGLKVTRDNLQQLLDRALEAEPLELHAFRRDELMLFAPTALPAAADTCELRLLPEVEPAVRARRAAWLGSGG
jgi:predicted metalloprotease with PDZ domain